MESTARLRLGVLLILIVVGLISSLGTAWRTGDWKGLFLNLGTEMLGAVATYVLLELFIGGREKKAALIRQMGSRVRHVATAAAYELKRHGWHRDGSLQGAQLRWANLQGAELDGADLQRAHLLRADLRQAYLRWANLKQAYLYGAKLQRADLQEAELRLAMLRKANLQEANLDRANLQEATLSRADLSKANLDRADLRGADLRWAILKGANLRKTNLQKANLQEANFDENTTLPDGIKWTPGTHTARFTDPDHPDFRQPDA